MHPLFLLIMATSTLTSFVALRKRMHNCICGSNLLAIFDLKKWNELECIRALRRLRTLCEQNATEEGFLEVMEDLDAAFAIVRDNKKMLSYIGYMPDLDPRDAYLPYRYLRDVANSVVINGSCVVVMSDGTEVPFPSYAYPWLPTPPALYSTMSVYMNRPGGVVGEQVLWHVEVPEVVPLVVAPQLVSATPRPSTDSGSICRGSVGSIPMIDLEPSQVFEPEERPRRASEMVAMLPPSRFRSTSEDGRVVPSAPPQSVVFPNLPVQPIPAVMGSARVVQPSVAVHVAPAPVRAQVVAPSPPSLWRRVVLRAFTRPWNYVAAPAQVPAPPAGRQVPVLARWPPPPNVLGTPEENPLFNVRVPVPQDDGAVEEQVRADGISDLTGDFCYVTNTKHVVSWFWLLMTLAVTSQLIYIGAITNQWGVLSILVAFILFFLTNMFPMTGHAVLYTRLAYVANNPYDVRSGADVGHRRMFMPDRAVVQKVECDLSIPWRLRFALFGRSGISNINEFIGLDVRAIIESRTGMGDIPRLILRLAPLIHFFDWLGEFRFLDKYSITTMTVSNALVLELKRTLGCAFAKHDLVKDVACQEKILSLIKGMNLNAKLTEDARIPRCSLAFYRDYIHFCDIRDAVLDGYNKMDF